MAKYAKKKQKKNRAGLLLIPALLLLALAVWLVGLSRESELPLLTPTGEPEQTEQTTAPTQPVATEAGPIALPEGLQILNIGSYAGIYMEDGSDEPLSDVMMIILENTAPQDLQLARISIEYADFTAEFEVTNIPSGEKVVALEKNRHSAVQEEYLSVSAGSVVFFPEPMSLGEDILQTAGSNGILEVTNVSGGDIAGDIYIYYKNSASDLLYGGITYRVEIKGGLPADGSVQVISGHYNPQNSRIVMVDWGD